MVALSDHTGTNVRTFNLTSDLDLDGIELIKNHPEQYEIVKEHTVQVPMMYIEYIKKPR